jgi:hypothetical protein
MADRIKIVSPDGKLGSIESSELDVALADGFRQPTEEDYINADNRKVADSTAGKIAASIGSGVNAATFGAFDAGLKAYAPEMAKALNTAREVNPISSGVGTAAGIGATLVNPAMGLVSKAGQAVGAGTKAALGASKIANVASKVAQFGAEGALISLPASSIEASVGDYEQAAENLLLGSGVGAGFGLGAGVLPTFLKAAGKTVEAAGSVVQPAGSYLAKRAKAFEMNQGGKILGFTKGIRDKLGNTRADELVGWAEKKGLIKVFEDSSDLASKVSKLQDEAGQVIGSVIKSVDDTGKTFVDTSKLLNNLQKVEVPEGELFANEANTFRKAMNDINSKLLDKKGEPKLVKLNVLQDLRKKLGDFAYGDYSQVRAGRQIVADMRKTIDDALGESIEFAEKTLPDQAKKWRVAKEDYGNYKQILTTLENKVSSEYGNQFIRPSDFGGAAIGGMTGGVAGAAGGYVVNSLRQQYGAQLAYKAVRAINRSIESRQASIDDAVNSFLGATSKVPRAIASEKVAPSSLGILSNFVNEQQPSRIKNLEKFNEELSSELMNPAQLQEKLAGLTQGLAQADTELGAGVYEKLIQTTKYLSDKAPKGTQVPTALNPYSYTPSDRDISSYERRVRAAVNPYSLLVDLNKGQISPEAVETVKDLYPTFYAQITRSILENGAASKKPLPYVKRLQVSTLLGTQLDGLSSKPNQKALQDNFAIEQQQQANANAAKPINSQLPNNMQTDVQRISAK